MDPVPQLINGCEICKNNDNQADLLICDGCEGEYHTRCIGLDAVPNGDWHCDQCVIEKKLPTLSIEETSIYAVDIQVAALSIQDSAGPPTQITIPRTNNSQTGNVTPDNIMSSPSDAVDESVPAIPRKGANVVLYVRVSTKKQDEPEHGRIGAVTQNAVIVKYCSDNAHRVTKVYEEYGSGSDITALAQHKKMLREIKPRTLIVVYSVSRFGRNKAQVMDAISTLHDMGCKVYSVSEDVYSTDSRFATLAELAESELTMMIRRLQDTRARQRALLGSGEMLAYGRPAYGKRRIRNANGISVFVDDPAEQQIIRFIVDNAGCRPAKIIHALERSGAATRRGRPWTVSMIRTLIKEYR